MVYTLNVKFGAMVLSVTIFCVHLRITQSPARQCAASHYSYSSKIIATYDGKHLYSGKYTYSSNILCTVDGPILIIFFTVL